MKCMKTTHTSLLLLLLVALLIGITPVKRAQANASAAKTVEAFDYLNKKYTKLAKKLPKLVYKNKAADPAGNGNLYVNGATFFRYNPNTKKIIYLQNGDSPELSLCGVKLDMTYTQAKNMLAKKKCTYVKTDKVNADLLILYYKKAGHEITVRIENNKVTTFFWERCK